MARWKVILGDCIELLPAAAKRYGPFDFIFADPPFNIGHDYIGYNDRKPLKVYSMWTLEWMHACWETCSGVMAIHGPDHVAEIFLQHAAALGIQTRRIAWVNWHYRFGQCNTSNWIDARCHCLIYAKNNQYTWNPAAVMVGSDRATVYADKRTTTTKTPGKRLPGTVWGVPSDGPYWGRVQGNSSERREGHPNQLPEVYLQRLLAAYTNPGDVVLDPFGGSGTTATVAVAMGRDCVTMDISEHNVRSIKERIKQGPVRL